MAFFKSVRVAMDAEEIIKMNVNTLQLFYSIAAQ